MSIYSKATDLRGRDSGNPITPDFHGDILQDIAKIVETVDTIADLKNFADAEVGDIVSVRSYHAGVDGGGGKFKLIEDLPVLFNFSSGATFNPDPSTLQFPDLDLDIPLLEGDVIKFEGGGFMQMWSDRPAGVDIDVNAWVLENPVSGQERGYLYKRTPRLAPDNYPRLDLPEGIEIESNVLPFGQRWQRIIEDNETDIRMWGAIPNENWDSTGNDASPAIQAAADYGGVINVRPSNTGNYYNIDNSIEINRAGVTFEFEGHEDVHLNEASGRGPTYAILYTNNVNQTFFEFFPNAPNAYKMPNFAFNGNITTYGVVGYNGIVFHLKLSAGMRYYNFNVFYSGNYEYILNESTFGDGGTVWFVDQNDVSTNNGYLSRTTFDGNLMSFGRGLHISDKSNSGTGTFTNGHWIYFGSDNGHQTLKFEDGGGLSFINQIVQTRSNLPQEDKNLEPIVDVNSYGCVVDVMVWDIRSNTSGRTTPQRGVKFYPADNPGTAINRTLLLDSFGYVEGIEFTKQNSYLRNPEIRLPMWRRSLTRLDSFKHNTLIGIDLKGTDSFTYGVYNATGYDLEANRNSSESAGLPSPSGLSVNRLEALCRHAGENVQGFPSFAQVEPTIDYTSSVDTDNDFLEIVYNINVLGTVDMEEIDVAFTGSGGKCKKVQVIGVDDDGVTITGSETKEPFNQGDSGSELMTFRVGDPNGKIIVRFIGFGNSSGGSIEISDIAGYMERLENSNMPLMPRTGGPIWDDVVWDNNGTGPVIEAPNGDKYRITVDNSGNLSATSL